LAIVVTSSDERLPLTNMLNMPTAAAATTTRPATPITVPADRRVARALRGSLKSIATSRSSTLGVTGSAG
jgi:hypothetical protein